MSFECWFITHSLQCKCDFCVLLKGLSGPGTADCFFQSVGRDTTLENPLCSTSTSCFLRASSHFSVNSLNSLPCSNTLENFKTCRRHFWQIICDTPVVLYIRLMIIFFKNSLLLCPGALILDRPLVFKWILQILQESLETMLVSFSRVLLVSFYSCTLELRTIVANYVLAIWRIWQLFSAWKWDWTPR